MGFVKSVGFRILKALVVFFLITYVPGLPPPMEFTPFSVSPAMPLKGKLELNKKLNDVKHLYEDQVKGPENLVEYNGELYTSIHGGNIVKIVDGKFVPVVKFGKPCVGLWQESVCGRPLGFVIDKNGVLYAADAYYGIFKYNIKTGTKTTLVSMNDTIDGKSPKLPNSVTVASDGTVYWTDSSSEMSLQDGIYSCLGDGSGRLIRYDPRTKKNTVLIKNIHFANGVALSPKEDFILVAETVRSRIHRYYLKGPKQGTTDIFIDGLPGLPDNLKLLGEEGFLVPLVASRDADNVLLFQVIGPYPILRKFLARVLALIEMPLQYIESIKPNYYTQQAIHWVGHFESVSVLNPKRVTVLHLDVDGNVVDSFHGDDGSVFGISDALIFKNNLYLGSPFNSYIGYVELQKPKNVPVIQVKE